MVILKSRKPVCLLMQVFYCLEVCDTSLNNTIGQNKLCHYSMRKQLMILHDKGLVQWDIVGEKQSRQNLGRGEK